ncbi:MAG: hypothetical protein HDR88_05320 [Bacteroides sp.]|nr:hypothetical protein [Bacteroides sp.]
MWYYPLVARRRMNISVGSVLLTVVAWQPLPGLICMLSVSLPNAKGIYVVSVETVTKRHTTKLTF